MHTQKRYKWLTSGIAPFLIIGAFLLIVVTISTNALSFRTAQANEGYLTADEISINGDNFRFTGGYFWADVCFDLPSTDDWHLSLPVLKYQDKAIAAYEIGVIEFGDGKGTQRCEEVSFPLQGETFAEFEITIPSLEVSQTDALDCDGAQRILDENSANIKISCILEEGYSGYEITDKPKSMTDEEAYAQIGQAFLSLVTKVEGPWSIIGVAPKE